MAEVELPYGPQLEADEISIIDFIEQHPNVASMPTNLEEFLPSEDTSSSIRTLLDQHTFLNFKEAYKVTSRYRGRCLIINNRFKNCRLKNLSERCGTDKDRDSLVRLFGGLNYRMTVKEECTADQIVSFCSMFILDPGFDIFDSCVLCILSHGRNREIYGTDGKKVKESEILGLFDKNPMLNGKPKLVIIQACRISTKKPLPKFCLGSNTTDTSNEGPATGDLNELIKTLQELNTKDKSERSDAVSMNTSDILIAYSTLPGMLSWRNAENGSWFIQAIVGVFERKSAREHVADMIVMVKYVIKEAFSGLQIPSAINHLSKKFYTNF